MRKECSPTFKIVEHELQAIAYQTAITRIAGMEEFIYAIGHIAWLGRRLQPDIQEWDCRMQQRSPAIHRLFSLVNLRQCGIGQPWNRPGGPGASRIGQQVRIAPDRIVDSVPRPCRHPRLSKV
jgi:hypothetical protein